VQTSGIRIECCLSPLAWAEEMSEVCRSMFVAICAVLPLEAFVRAPDGQANGAAFRTRLIWYVYM
jgi:hypothetical protein